MKRVFFYLALTAILTTKCGDDNGGDKIDNNLPNNNDEPPKEQETVTTGLWILSEGIMNSGNGQLAYYAYNSATDQFVPDATKRFQNFGETPNDLLIYGAKMYAAIQGSGANDGMVRVINPFTGEKIEEIVINHDGFEQQPRRLAASSGKVFVTLMSGAVAQIDTASFVTQVTELSGTHSDGICVNGQLLYICNSGFGEGNTVSVVSISGFTEIDVINVPYNPVNILSIGNDELFLNTAFVWTGPAEMTLAKVHVLNTVSKTITETLEIGVESIVAGKNYIYGAAADWSTMGSILKKISITDKIVSEFNESSGNYMHGYKLSMNPVTNEIFLTQIMGDNVWRFKEDGTLIETITVGQQNGTAIVFVNIANH